MFNVRTIVSLMYVRICTIVHAKGKKNAYTSSKSMLALAGIFKITCTKSICAHKSITVPCNTYVFNRNKNIMCYFASYSLPILR